MPRPREHILGNLESLYREAHARAQATGDHAEQARLDFEFRRDQLYLEAGAGRARPAAPAPAASRATE